MAIQVMNLLFNGTPLTFGSEATPLVISVDIPTDQEALNIFYPVGTYYTTMDATFDPNVTFVGTWVKDTDGLVTVATNGADVGSTGGEETHAITVNEMPAHTHTTRIGSVSPWKSANAPDQSSITSQWSRAYGNGTIGSYPRCSMYGTATFSCSKNGDNHNNIMPSKIAIRWHRTA